MRFSCTSGYYGNTVDGTCTKCHSFCTECYGPLKTNCTAYDMANRYTLVQPDTCQYLECPELTYFNDTTFTSEKCDLSCGNCYGGNPDNCIDWPYSTFIRPDDTWKSWTQINSFLKFVAVTYAWNEIWGKGVNLGFVGCDDNNNVDGDGCDEFCNIETNWECESGTETQPDQRVSLIGPRWEISSVSSVTHSISIACDEEIRFNEVTDTDLDISINGPRSVSA